MSSSTHSKNDTEDVIDAAVTKDKAVSPSTVNKAQNNIPAAKSAPVASAKNLPQAASDGDRVSGADSMQIATGVSEPPDVKKMPDASFTSAGSSVDQPQDSAAEEFVTASEGKTLTIYVRLWLLDQLI